MKVHAENSILQGNSAVCGGGGGMNIVMRTVTLTSTTFASNSADNGGGIYMEIAVMSLCVSAVSSPTQHHMVMQYIHPHQQ